MAIRISHALLTRTQPGQQSYQAYQPQGQGGPPQVSFAYDISLLQANDRVILGRHFRHSLLRTNCPFKFLLALATLLLLKYPSVGYLQQHHHQYL